MEGFNGKITMSTCEGRPCWVKGRRAIFHRWSDSARPVKPASNDQDTDERLQKWSVHGIVEYEDGTVEREWPSAIQFADSREYFDGLAWEEMEARRDALPYDQAQDPDENNGGMGYLKTCATCAHEKEKVGMCPDTGLCCECPLPCTCKECVGFGSWEPKGGAVCG